MKPVTDNDGLRDYCAPWRDVPTSWLTRLIDRWHQWKAGK